MVLVDSSTWIELIRGSADRHASFLRRLLADGRPVSITATVLQEVLQGARDAAHFDLLRARFATVPLLVARDGAVSATAAARLYAAARWRGLALRSPNDCLIAAVAIEHGVPVLASDRDFSVLRRIEPALATIDPIR